MPEMTKLFVDVFLPGNGKTYEFQLDSSMLVEKATDRIINNICEAENNTVSIDPATAVLSDVSLSSRLDAGMTLQAAGVKSGHKLILV